MATVRKALLAFAILSSIFPRWQDGEWLPANDIPMGCALLVQGKEVAKAVIATRWEGKQVQRRSVCGLWHRGYRL